MNAAVVMRELESPALIADARLASTGRALLRRLRRHEAMERALKATDLSMADELADRACALRGGPADPGFTNPSDLAVCAYAVLLHDAWPAMFGAVAERLLVPSRHFPWASALASALEPTPAVCRPSADAKTVQVLSLSGAAWPRWGDQGQLAWYDQAGTVLVPPTAKLRLELAAIRATSCGTPEYCHA